MPLKGPWTDSTGTGHTYPNAYLVAHERIDTLKQIVYMDVTVWASSAQVGFTPVLKKTYVPTSTQIDNIVAFINDKADTALQNKAPFSGMSTTG